MDENERDVRQLKLRTMVECPEGDGVLTNVAICSLCEYYCNRPRHRLPLQYVLCNYEEDKK